MDDHEILQHLLELEKEAAALVNEAQAEADRRVSEGERQNRARHDEIYAREVEALEAAYVQNIASVRESYRKQLEEYGENLKTVSLNAVSLNMEAFSSLAEKYLFSSAPSDREA